MVKQIPFLQLIPHPFTPRDANYHIELPYLVNLNNIIENKKKHKFMTTIRKVKNYY
jgi:hypothetical protein